MFDCLRLPALIAEALYQDLKFIATVTTATMATITFILIRTNMTNTAKADNNTEADNTGIMGITDPFL